jgi:hypothetical protein
MKLSVSSVMNLTGDVKYAAVYARVSTEDQGKGFSIPTQLEACQKLAAQEGYTVPEGYVLIDEGISGTTMDRPALRKLRDLVNTKAIAAATVIDPDRLSRNLGHQLLLAEEFERAGVKLLIVSHPMEAGPEGWMFFQMRGAAACPSAIATWVSSVKGIGRWTTKRPQSCAACFPCASAGCRRERLPRSSPRNASPRRPSDLATVARVRCSLRASGGNKPAADITQHSL